MDDGMTEDPVGTADATTEREDMEVEITATEATEAVGMITGTGITQEFEKKAQETENPEAGGTREDVWRTAEQKGVQPRLWPGPQLRQSGHPRQSQKQR